MAYTINKFNGEPLVVLQDGSIDVSTSLQLVGRSYVGYGEIQNENFVFLMENFANNNPPARPIKGQTWFDTTSNLLNLYDGEKWAVLGSAQLSATAPEDPPVGYLWLETPANVLYVWNGASWSFIGPEKTPGFGDTRAKSQTLVDTDGIENPVILLTVNNTVVAICSSRTFTINPTNSITGFTNITAGVTLSETVKFTGQLNGLADRATRLANLRTINGVGFDGTSNITITAATNGSLTPGDHLLGDPFDGSSEKTWNIDAASANLPGKLVVRNNQGGFAAGTITADLVGNVTGNVTATSGTSTFSTIRADRFIGPALSGNADTATRLRFAREINGVLFDGSANITVAASANTLTGTSINNTVRFSNLQTVGTLQILSVANPGVRIGSTNQFTAEIVNNVPTLKSQNDLNIVCDAAGPDISLLGPLSAQNQGGAAEPAIVGNNSVNLGLVNKKFNNVYANNFRGVADTATLAITANNVAGGGPGSILFQTAASSTSSLAIGSAGSVLTVGSENQLVWRATAPLVPGDYIVGDSYNTTVSRSWKVDATSTNSANKIVARDSSGNIRVSTAEVRSVLIDNPGTAEIRFNTSPGLSELAISVQGENFVIYEPDDNNREWFRINDVNVAGGNQSAFVYGNKVYAHNNVVFSSGAATAVGFTNQVGSFNNNSNYFDVFPPAGYTMNNLQAFIPSIRVIHFNGRVNNDDSLRCTYSLQTDRIRVWVQNTEQRSTPAGNWLAIWRR